MPSDRFLLVRTDAVGAVSPFPGSCKHMWLEAMRASSAAPYFFEEFSCGGERFMDGAIAANNPSIIALHEVSGCEPTSVQGQDV